MINEFINVCNAILFYNIFGYVPLIVLWLAGIAVFLMIKLNFPSITMFGHSMHLLISKYGKTDSATQKNDEVSAIKAILTSIASTLGLGNIAGTAVAIAAAGPGTIFWILVFGFFGMTVKSAEVYLGHKYRVINANNGVSGGPFYYLRDGLAKRGLRKFGLFLGFIFAIFTLIAIFGMSGFQMNQMVTVITGGNKTGAGVIDFLMMPSSLKVVGLSFAITAVIVVVVMGGLSRISNLADKIVPFMVIFYILACFTVLAFNIKNVLPSLQLIIVEAFNFKSGLSGFLVILVNGARRSIFACEAGQGTSPIVNANSDSKYSQEQAILAMIDPLISSILCVMTGLVLIASGAYLVPNINGLEMSTYAFKTVSDWFEIALIISAALLAFTTVMTDTFYGRKAIEFLAGSKIEKPYMVVFIVFIFFSGFCDLSALVSFADVFVLLMSVPNVIGLYILSGEIKTGYHEYRLMIKQNKAR